MRRLCLAAILCLLISGGFAVKAPADSTGANISRATQSCLECHQEATPGIVADWKKSRHARITPAMGLLHDKASRRISSEKVPEALLNNVVGCAECHVSLDEDKNGSFEHDEFKVHTVVSPKDCARCHQVEAEQFGENLMSHAYANLMDNSLYQKLAGAVNDIPRMEGGRLVMKKAGDLTNMDSCLYCHGTKLTVNGTRTVESDLGEFEFPVLKGWPNHGVGRINPDGSKGNCAACHSRHQFSIEMARKPHTCSECHKGPDVPAYKVYQVSKHGGVYSSMKAKWDFNAVPWKLGKDFTAPTCAACHMSLLTDGQGNVITQRSHLVNDRLSHRLQGLIYSAAHPKSPDTSIIKGPGGLPLPTTLSGEPVKAFLISEDEMQIRKGRMQAVCLACHSTGWVKGQYRIFENTIKTSNAATLAATKIVEQAWQKGLADSGNPFDETIERMWVEQWLFFGNNSRYASAMMGADHGVFAHGRWYQRKNLQKMREWLTLLEKAKK